MANAYAKGLVKTGIAMNFLSMAGTESGRNVMLGNVDNLPEAVRPYIIKAHIFLRDAVDKVGSLEDDETRTDVAKHAAAHKVASETIAELARVRNVISEHASKFISEANEEADTAFAPKAGNGALESEIRNHIRQKAASGEGCAVVQELVKSDAQAASVVYHSPAYLLGLPSDVHMEARVRAMERWLPDTSAKMDAGVTLGELAAKYDRPIEGMRTSFYAPHMVKLADTRVEV